MFYKYIKKKQVITLSVVIGSFWKQKLLVLHEAVHGIEF